MSEEPYQNGKTTCRVEEAVPNIQRMQGQVNATSRTEEPYPKAETTSTDQEAVPEWRDQRLKPWSRTRKQRPRVESRSRSRIKRPIDMTINCALRAPAQIHRLRCAQESTCSLNCLCDSACCTYAYTPYVDPPPPQPCTRGHIYLSCVITQTQAKAPAQARRQAQTDTR